jgi:hypothetical protein
MAVPFVPVPGVLQCNLRFTLLGHSVENVLCFRYGGTSFPTAVSGIQTILQTEWWNPIRGALSNQLLHIENYYTDLSDQAGPVSSQPAFSSPTGGHASPSVPGNVAVVVTHRTANRGKSYRGRTYLAGLGKDFLTGNTVSGSAIAVFETGFNDLIDATNAALVPFVIVSRRHNNDGRVEGIDTVVTLSLCRDDQVDTQRGRLR